MVRRKEPGIGMRGKYYHITIRPKSEFVIFRNHDVGKTGMIERVAGKTSRGTWHTQKWLVSKNMAKARGGILVPETEDARKLFAIIGTPKHVKGNVYKARGRKNVPERAKPTAAQKRARTKNIKKAQKARLRMGKNPRGKGKK